MFGHGLRKGEFEGRTTSDLQTFVARKEKRKFICKPFNRYFTVIQRQCCIFSQVCRWTMMVCVWDSVRVDWNSP